jgi:ribosome biogenesis GTPase A
MTIQWYPGHMHKAAKDIRKILPAIDVFIEILDARIPFSSRNPMLERLRGDKPCIKILNKIDLADAGVTQSWQEYWDLRHNIKTLAVSCKQQDKIKLLPALCRKMLPNSDDNRQIQVLIMGIPNVGKSTIINGLAGKMIAKTGNEPAITKMQQRIAIERHIVLFDTPGLLWPKVENNASGYRLAVTGAIKDTAISYQDIGLYLADFLAQHYAEQLKSRFNLTTLPITGQGIIESIGKKRGCLKAGGIVDLEKASKILINELRAGMLGAISLETPAIMEQELAELTLIRRQKEDAKKAAHP